MDRKFTVNDFFCGAGGVGLGFLNAGFNVIWACDFDKYAVETYRKNVGDWVVRADIKALESTDIPVADVWTFGFPCQDLSVAGKQKGFRFVCKDCGSEYGFEKEQEVKCPECGSHNYQAATRSGLFFEVMRLLDGTPKESKPKVLLAENVKGLKPYIPALEAEFIKRGYIPHIQMFNSKYWGVPQSRERYYIVGTRDIPFSFPEEQHEFIPKLSSILSQNVDEKYYLPDEKAQTIIKQALERLPSLGNTHATLTPDRVNKRQNGRRAKGDEEEMYTLTAQDVHRVIVQIPKEYLECVVNDRGFVNKPAQVTEIAPTLRAQDHGNQPKVVECLPKIEVIGKLDVKGMDIIRRVYSEDGIAPTINTCQGGQRQVKILDTTRYRVRRLTPTEYGRLQAFPMDHWEQVVSDSQAYKQFGNAVTVNVVEAIAKEIRRGLSTE